MASREDTLLRIQLLKKQLSQSEEFQKDFKELAKARNTLEKEIEMLKEEVDKLEIDNLLPHSKENLLQECLIKQRQIDHRLDNLEEWSDERIAHIRQELISLILEIHPQQKQVYKDLAAGYQQIYDLKGMLGKTERCCKQIIESINEALRIRGKVRKRSVFSYILGPNPNILIAKRLQHIHEISSKMAKECPDIAKNRAASKNLKALYEALEIQLNELEAHSRSRWGFKTLDTTFTEAKNNLKQILESHNLERTAVDFKLCACEEDLDQWIEKNSRAD